jgi:hypothetical protein
MTKKIHSKIEFTKFKNQTKISDLKQWLNYHYYQEANVEIQELGGTTMSAEA